MAAHARGRGDHRASYEQYARVHLDPAFGDVPIGKINARLLEEFYAGLRHCRDRCGGRPRIEYRFEGPDECRTVRHCRGPGRPPAGGYPAHDCAETGCTVTERQPHTCQPPSAATIRRIHFAIRGVLSVAERWESITSNPGRDRPQAAPADTPAQPADGGPGRSTRRGSTTRAGARGSDRSW